MGSRSPHIIAALQGEGISISSFLTMAAAVKEVVVVVVVVVLVVAVVKVIVIVIVGILFCTSSFLLIRREADTEHILRY